MRKAISIFCCVVIILATILTLSACGSSAQEDWSSIILGKNLPTPQEGTIRSGSNLDNIFMGGIKKVDEDYYKEYKQACIDMGYTIDTKESGNTYDAFNADGYKLSLSYYSNEIHISLNAPTEMEELDWPTTGIGARLPAPESTIGDVVYESSKSFQVIVGNTTLDDFNDYVDACEQQGFNVDYTKTDGNYSAKDAEGYRLSVRYAGYNQVEITIQTPTGESSTPSVDTDDTNDTTNNSEENSSESDNSQDNSSNSSIGADFKKAMDDYEAFMDEYVAFMKKYQANPTDLSLLTDYANYISKYADFVESFSDWGTEDMNAAETAYYIDVQARVNKKLLEVAS